MNHRVFLRLLTILILAIPLQSSADNLLTGVSSIKLDFTEDFVCFAQTNANGDQPIPNPLNWTVWETGNKRRCQIFQTISSKNVLYREFGYDGDKSFLYRPSDNGKLIIKKGFYPAYQDLLDLRNPIYLLFGNEYFACKDRQAISCYVPLLDELQHAQPSPVTLANLDPKDFDFTSALLSQAKNLKVVQSNLTTKNLFFGPTAKPTTLISVIDPLLGFPIAWIRKSTGSQNTQSISYQVLQTQLIKDASGRPLAVPLKSILTYKMGDFTVSQVTFTIKSLQFNAPDVENQTTFDPSSASMIEDVDSASIINVPK